MKNDRNKEVAVIVGAIVVAGAILWAFLAPPPRPAHAAVDQPAIRLPAPHLPTMEPVAEDAPAEVPDAGMPAEAPVNCEYPALAISLGELARKCNDQKRCKVTGGTFDPANAVDMNQILTAAGTFPVEVVYFGAGETDVGAAGRRRIARFVADTLATANKREERMSFMVFGAASPTADQRDDDIQYAQARTESAGRTVIDAATDLASTMFADVHQTNIGPDTLAVEYCEKLPDDGSLRRRCRTLNENRRRQVAVVLAVPHECIGAATPAPKPVEAPVAAGSPG